MSSVPGGIADVQVFVPVLSTLQATTDNPSISPLVYELEYNCLALLTFRVISVLLFSNYISYE